MVPQSHRSPGVPQVTFVGDYPSQIDGKRTGIKIGEIIKFKKKMVQS